MGRIKGQATFYRNWLQKQPQRMQNGGSVSAFYWSSLISPFSSSYFLIAILHSCSTSLLILLLFSSAMYLILSIIH